MPQGVNIPVNMVVNNAGLAQQLLQTDKAAQKAAAGMVATMTAATASINPQLQSVLNTLSKYKPHQISAAYGPAMAQNLAIYQQRAAHAQKAAQNGYQMPAYNGPTPGAISHGAGPSYMNNMLGTMALVGTGNFRQIGTSMAMGFIAALTNTTGTSYGIGTRLLGALGTGQASSSFGGSALGLVGSLIKMGPLGWALGVGALGVGSVLAASGTQAEKSRNAALLSAKVGGVGGHGLDFAQTAFDTAQKYNYDPSIGADVASTLGLLGAPAAGMFDRTGRGGTLGAVFAASRQSQLDPQTIAQYFGAQMGAGGQSLVSVIKSFRTLEEQSAKTKIPLDRLIEETQRFGQATGGAVPNMQSLAGIQSALGPGVSAGGLIAPLSNATGSDAYKAAALLGIPVGKLQQLQFGGPDHKGNQAQLLDLLSAETKKITAGRPADQARTLAETFLNNTQLLDTSGLSAYKYSSLIDTMIYGSSKQFQKAAQGVGQGLKFSSTEDWENQMITASQDQTDIMTRIEQDLKGIQRGFGNFMPDVNHIMTGIEDLVKHFDPGQWLKDFGNLFKGGDTTGGPTGGPTKTAASRYNNTIYDAPATFDAHGIPHPVNASDALTPGNHAGGFVSGDAFNTFGVVPNFKGSKNRMPVWQWAMIQKAAKSVGEDPFMLAAEVGQESSFNPFATNASGAKGLGQIMPSTAKWLAGQMGLKNPDLYNPQTSLNMRAFLDAYNEATYGSWNAAAAHSGTGTDYAAGIHKIEVELGGKIQVVDSNGKVYGTIDANSAIGVVKSSTPPRKPVASRHPAPNPHMGGHHSQ